MVMSDGLRFISRYSSGQQPEQKLSVRSRFFFKTFYRLHVDVQKGAPISKNRQYQIVVLLRNPKIKEMPLGLHSFDRVNVCHQHFLMLDLKGLLDK